MSNWRDRILSEFTPGVARLTLVADPDALVSEEGVLSGIRERGFESILFEDSIAFRYTYESGFRARWDQSERSDLVVVLRSGAADLRSLPFDLLEASRRLTFSLGELFPNMSQAVVSALDRSTLDALYDAQRRYAPSVLGDNATREFVLRHVFGIAPELIVAPVDLLRVLLRRHFAATTIPSQMAERLVQLIRRREEFRNWPLEVIVPSREAFLAFLQERWPLFLDRMAELEPRSHQGVRDEPVSALAYPGPVDLQFDHDDIRVYMDNLFLEGHLQPVEHPRAESLSKTWLAVGIRTNERADRDRRLDGLIDAATGSIPSDKARHEDWLRFARIWAEINALRPELTPQPPESGQGKFETLRTQVDAAFKAWIEKRYAGLASLPPVPPVMLHHVPRLLVRYLQHAQENKAALLLIDGLSLDQWVAVRQELAEQRPEYRLRESAVFAWIPTVTSVSRQAAFAGRPPFYFPHSIHTTNREPALWRLFWTEEGMDRRRVVYEKALGDGALDDLAELTGGPTIRVAGLVIDKVDRIMHGMELGAAGMHNQVRQWTRQGYLANLLDLLVERGFRVYLTSDHGNIEASGCGRPAEGAGADMRGERVRVYREASLRSQVRKRFPAAREWRAIGLPDDYLPLLAGGRSAFIRENERIVGHGGACIEEVIVPLIRIDGSKP